MEFINTYMTDTIRQVIAETLFIFDVGLAIFIIAHLQREVRDKGFIPMRRELGNQAAMAVLVHITGLALIRGWTTLQYILKGRGSDVTSLEEAYQIPSIGLIIAVVGMACCIRIFSPIRYGNWGWILTMMAALGFVGFIHGT